MKRKENFQWLPKELHQLKYEAISVPQGSVRLVKKTQERKSSTCYLLITKGVTSSSPVPLKTRRERERLCTVTTCKQNITKHFLQKVLSYINVELQSNARVIGDGPRKFKPRSSDEEDT
ncbi:uncharacterized protein TNCV_993141 [Trichonephila clavipes]|nr:uncharacterized protein TNCV_993141 [Trichonephila clavipes]